MPRPRGRLKDYSTKPKRTRRKAEKSIEIVECCDACGKDLKSTVGRCVGSFALGQMHGVYPSMIEYESSAPEFFFFCSEKCRRTEIDSERV